jgi:spermidine synthase
VLLAAVLTSVPFVPAALAQPPSSPATASAAAPTPTVIFDKPSAYGRVFVVEEGRRRMLRFDDVNGVDQSAMSIDDPASVPMEYVRYAALGLLFVPQVESVLMIGLGGGSFTGLIHRALPEVRIDAIEIDPVVVEAARRFFGLVEDERYRVHIADGAAFVRDTKLRYDLILADAGVADGIPEHHTTDPFFSALRERLTPDGVLVVNLGLDERGNAIIVERIKSAFGADACTGVSTPVDANYLVFASKRPSAPRATQLRARAEAIDARRLLPYSLAPLAGRLGRCP